MPRARKPLATLLSLSILFALTQIALGGIVRVTGSGDACPDWPACFGQIIPDELENWQVLLEWGHRANGVVLGIIAIISTLYAAIGYWSDRRQSAPRSRLTLIAAAVGLVLVIITGVIGGTVVLNDLHPALRTLHLLLAQLVVLSFVLALLAELRLGIHKTGTLVKSAALVSLVAIFANIAFGSYVVWQGAGGVCMSWPVCNFSEGLLPDSELEWINVTHRLLTLVTTVLVFVLMLVIRRRLSGVFKFAAYAAIAAILLEIVVGAAIATTPTESLFWLYNVWRAIHIGLSSVIWAAACFVAVGALVSYKKS